MIAENVQNVLKEIAGGNAFGEKITLVAATKTRTPEEINEAIAAGVTDIGENKVQEFRAKYDLVHGANRHLYVYLLGKIPDRKNVPHPFFGQVGACRRIAKARRARGLDGGLSVGDQHRQRTFQKRFFPGRRDVRLRKNARLPQHSGARTDGNAACFARFSTNSFIMLVYAAIL